MQEKLENNVLQHSSMSLQVIEEVLFVKHCTKLKRCIKTKGSNKPNFFRLGI